MGWDCELAVELPLGSKDPDDMPQPKLTVIMAPAEVQVECEIHILQRASCHPNIVEFLGWYWDAEHVMCMVLGYCAGGSLDSLIGPTRSGKKAYHSEEQIMAWFVQLLAALNHLHSVNIIHRCAAHYRHRCLWSHEASCLTGPQRWARHAAQVRLPHTPLTTQQDLPACRDIKPQNIFLSKCKKLIRLGDLGIAKELEESDQLVTTCLGTPYYMSPELMAQQPYTVAADVWALGSASSPSSLLS